jgi:large subunit ribosomal protein L9
MKVILLSDIKGVGKKDQVIEASDGYARNYLFPKKLALEANTENMSKLKSRQNSNQFRKDTEKKQAEEIAKKLKGIMLKIKVRAGENGKIFGGVTSKEISDGLKRDYNIDIDKKKILLNETIKTIGTFTIDIKLYEGVIGKLKIDVIA